MANRRFTDSEEEQIARIYLSGKSAKSIMRAYGLQHHEAVMGALRRQNIIQRPVSERNRIYKLNRYAFDDLSDEHAAYWHGFLYADGCVSRDKVLTVALSSKDESQLVKFKRFMQTEVGITHSYFCTPSVRITITDKYLGQRLQNTGITKGRPVPQLLFDSIPDISFHHWLRGFFDGDGSARKSPSIVFCGDKEFLLILRNKISKLCNVNQNLSITKHNTRNLHYLYYAGRLTALEIAGVMYKEATIWMQRKRDVIERWALPQKKN